MFQIGYFFVLSKTMTSLQISEENLLKMISDVKNMKKEFRCAFLSCDLNEDRIIVLPSSAQAQAKQSWPELSLSISVFVNISVVILKPDFL